MAKCYQWLGLGFALLSSFCWSQQLELKGELRQGELNIGHLPGVSALMLDDKPLNVTADGWFVFGFGRDDSAEHVLQWKDSQGVLQQRVLTPKSRQFKIERIDGLPAKMVTPDPELINRIRNEARKVKRARQTDHERTDFLQPFIWPAQGRISGVYGSQRILNGQPKTPHYGVDVAAPTGTDVVAPADGIVTLWEPDLYYSGGTMIIDHGFGVSSTFLHLSASYVEVGQRVEQGQKVAEIGATGRATGPHLDWRINWFSTRLDPQLLVPPMQ